MLNKAQEGRTGIQLFRFSRTSQSGHFCTIAALFILFMDLFSVSCRQEVLPPSPVSKLIFSACITPGTPATLEVVTFNAEGFPKAGYTSVTAMASLLKAIDPDVIAFQEIASSADFDRLTKLMEGWSGFINPTNNDQWDLAYLVKNSEVSVVPSSEKLLFTDDAWAFPRPPHELKLKHKSSGKEFYIVNLHLKCCQGSDNENSRKSASQKLKAYLDATKPDQPVIVLGDFNGTISSASPSENPFLNFIDDPVNYRFTDMEIAKGSPLWWSYPSYPSHIDHILVTNEIFSGIDTTEVLKASPCFPEYEAKISDHRPVELRMVFK